MRVAVGLRLPQGMPEAIKEAAKKHRDLRHITSLNKLITVIIQEWLDKEVEPKENN